MKMRKVYRQQTNGRTDSRQTTGDQKSSLEPSTFCKIKKSYFAMDLNCFNMSTVKKLCCFLGIFNRQPLYGQSFLLM